MKTKKTKKKKIAGKIIIICLIAANVISGTLLWKSYKRQEDFSLQLNKLYEEMESKTVEIEALKKTERYMDVYIPEQLYVAVGRTLELYNEQILYSGEAEDYAFNWVCDIGKNLERQYQVTAQTKDIGDHELQLNIYDPNLNLVFEKTCILTVVDDVIEEKISLLNIGDSLSDSTIWYDEIINLSKEQITFVGTRGTEGKMHEGRSGFSICDYLTETPYNFAGEGVHPFFNPDKGTFDYKYYKDKTGIDADAVQIFLGKNGMSLDPGPGIEWLKEIVNAIREEEPDIPVYIVQTVYMGDQNGIGNVTDNKGNSALNGWFKLEEDKKVFLWTKALDEAFGVMKNTYLIPAALTFDSKYNYNAQELGVNARSSKMQNMIIEGMHPNNEGYLQIADTMYSVYCATMK